MTRDSAAVAALDDRRRRCPISAASNVVDDASTLMTNSIAMSGSSSNDDVGGGDEGGSLKSSSEVSTTTSCCGGSSSSSRSGSDDDDSATVTRLTTAIDDSCSTTIKTPPSLHKRMEDDNNGDKESSSSSHSDEAAATTTPTNIGGRLTFYKDGKFIFQLAAHHQQNPCNNPSALTSPCRWVPVPTVIQQHKNNVKCIGEWSQHQQNKTIWPYSVTNNASESNSPQPVQQLQPPTVRIGERKQQNFQHRTTPPPLSLITGAVNTATHTGGVVVATTTNIVRRPSRKCSTTVTAENITNFHHQRCQPLTQLRGLPRRSQQHQHQAFMMVATEAIKVQRRLLSLPKKQRLWCQRKRKSMTRNSLLQELKPPQINLECFVRNLWCRRHTTELLLRRQLSINNSGDNVAATISAVVDVTPTVISRHVAVSTASVVDSTCPNTGGSKRRSMVSPSPSAAILIPITATSMNLGNKSGNSSPHKKYKSGHQQQQEQILQPQRRVVVDKIVKKAIPQPPPQVISTNDHSITAILSGGAAGAKRSGSSGAVSMVMDPENGIVTTTTTTTSAVLSPHKNLHTPSPAPLSLLRTLLKSPSSESSSPPIAASTNGVGYRHHTNGSRKRSSVESTAVSSLPSINTAAIKVENGLGTSPSAIPSVGANAADNASTVLTALHQLPTIHHPAAGQLAAAGYFNVLYHRAAMAAAAMAYQTHAQLPQPLPKSQPPSLLSSQFPTTSGASTTWQRHLAQRPPLLHPPEAIVGSGVTNTAISSSISTVVAPYSSPLIAATVNGSSLLPPATPSPPPPLMLHPHSAHRHHLLLHHQQQYQPAPTVQQQPSSFHQHNHRQQSSSLKKRSGVAIGVTEYGVCIEENNSGVVATLDEESSSSADCVPLNLSKDSIAENVSGTSPTARVR
ncbi:uncharacterized protein LOC111040718 [Myzus persicae]|uniref:uncharacterized protein LOC111040718 n=1 Tax=Myzus persicae TaxID=13164 RepID=UPI000B936DFA|nr:uncharacterized protein LOC111040718 [Myzus persicae]